MILVFCLTSSRCHDLQETYWSSSYPSGPVPEGEDLSRWLGVRPETSPGPYNLQEPSTQILLGSLHTLQVPTIHRPSGVGHPSGIRDCIPYPTSRMSVLVFYVYTLISWGHFPEVTVWVLDPGVKHPTLSPVTSNTQRIWTGSLGVLLSVGRRRVYPRLVLVRPSSFRWIYPDHKIIVDSGSFRSGTTLFPTPGTFFVPSLVPSTSNLRCEGGGWMDGTDYVVIQDLLR